MTNTYLAHNGVLGQRWGIRRYQNKDGSITQEGRRKLGLDQYDIDHNQDTVLKKGTKVSRVVSTARYDELKNPEFGGSDKTAKKYLDDIFAKEAKLDNKYVSVDGVKSGKEALEEIRKKYK